MIPPGRVSPETEFCRADKLILHTRRMMLTTVLVASTILVCVIIGRTPGIDKARMEAEIVQRLIDHADHYLASDESLTIGHVLTGGYVRSHARSKVKLSVATQPGPDADTTTCTLRFNLHYPMFVYHGTFGIEYGHAPDKNLSASHRSLIPSNRHIDLLASIPKTLREFARFWNLLDQSSASNVIGLHFSEGEVIDIGGENNTNPTKLSFAVKHQSEETEHKEHGTRVWILTPGTESANTNIPNSIETIKSWTRNGYSVLASTACEEDKNIMATMPAKLGHYPFAWQAEWVELVLGGKESTRIPVKTGRFSEVFPNLYAQTTGHGNVLVAELNEWLAGQKRSLIEHIAIFGMKVPVNFVLIFGPAIIIMLQFFTLLYMLDLRTQLTQQEGILRNRTEPWTVLQAGLLPATGTVLIAGIPAVGSAFAGFGMNLTSLEHFKFVLYDNPYSFILVVISIALSACSLWAVWKMRRMATNLVQ